MSNKMALDALKFAEAALADIGDADREPGDDLAWCEARAAEALPRTRAAIAALQAEPQGWMPIETAPKGRKVLVAYKNKLGNWRCVLACYYLPQTLQMEDDRDDFDDDGYAPEGWYEESETQDAIWLTDEPPTHWMPLPTPPKD